MKHGRADRICAVKIGLPCLFRRGHIEAAQIRLRRLGAQRLPCLFRRGHIEAVSGEPRSSSFVAHYPACLGGATLKHARRRCDSRHNRRRLPCLFRRGHIEARPLCRRVRGAKPHYPACLGGATLKRQVIVVVYPHHAPLPCLFRRGHIEATAGASAGFPQYPHYPACLGGATLKRVSRQAVEDRLRITLPV